MTEALGDTFEITLRGTVQYRRPDGSVAVAFEGAQHNNILDAGVIALARLQLSLPTGSREAIARIIDPKYWAIRDRHYAQIELMTGLDADARAVHQRNADMYTRDSLAKADAILALSPSPGGGLREALEELHEKIETALACQEQDVTVNGASHPGLLEPMRDILRSLQKRSAACLALTQAPASQGGA